MSAPALATHPARLLMSDSIAASYRRMSDERLLQIALHEASGLTPDGLAALHAELGTRGIDPVIGRAIAAQRTALNADDLGTLVGHLRQQPCPECGRTDQPLNAGIVATAKSFLIVTLYNRRTLIACPDCLVRSARSAAIVTALLGWWGFPFGPIRSVQSLFYDIRTLRQARQDEPTQALQAFVRANPGVVVAALGGRAAG